MGIGNVRVVAFWTCTASSNIESSPDKDGALDMSCSVGAGYVLWQLLPRVDRSVTTFHIPHSDATSFLQKERDVIAICHKVMSAVNILISADVHVYHRDTLKGVIVKASQNHQGTQSESGLKTRRHISLTSMERTYVIRHRLPNPHMSPKRGHIMQ